MSEEQIAKRIAEALSTEERVALCGPRNFGAQFEKSVGAQKLLARELIMAPTGRKETARLTPLGERVRRHFSKQAITDE